MNLPRLLVLTDRSRCRGSLAETVGIAVHYGARAFVVREKDLPGPDRAELAHQVRAMLAPLGATVILAGAGGWEAVHLAAADPFPASRPALVGRSCHNADEIGQASAEGCDYITVSPVFPTASKPGYGPALGRDGLARLAAIAPPVFALGGIQPDDVGGVLDAGAYGIAVMGPIMREPALVADYLAQLRNSEVPA